ncbi:MAG: hypothetical protein IKU01_08850 [Bacteroidales bacterium]|nr:hypothetical protein [Bacteroidales bacterium]
MRKKILILLFTILPILGMAQNDYKLVEQSAKKKPEWCNNSTCTKGAFFIKEEKVATINEASSKAMNQLLKEIARAVAVQIETASDKSGLNSKYENGKYQTERYLESVIETKFAKLPALHGITLSKADIYWERFIEKKTKETSYDYYVLYPFTEIDLREITEAYEEQEKALNDKINGYRDNLEYINDVDVLMENINEMKSMIKEMGESDVKSNALKDIISLYENVINNMYIEVLDNNKDGMLIQLKHNDKVMKTKSLPQVKSDNGCTRDFSVKHNGNNVKITYNTFDCYEQDDNYVEIKFTFAKKRIVKKVLVNL